MYFKICCLFLFDVRGSLRPRRGKLTFQLVGRVAPLEGRFTARKQYCVTTSNTRFWGPNGLSLRENQQFRWGAKPPTSMDGLPWREEAVWIPQIGFRGQLLNEFGPCQGPLLLRAEFLPVRLSPAARAGPRPAPEARPRVSGSRHTGSDLNIRGQKDT